MTTAAQQSATVETRIPATMRAAVYRAVNDVRVEEVPVPEISDGELLVKIHTCGICGTDLKKIATGSHSAPRVFGHEMSGTVVAVGTGVAKFKLGDRVMVFHHIPCGDCYYCKYKVFAQCPTYKKVGATAGFEPSGGGFAEYIRVMDWIVERGGVVHIPDNVCFEQASFIEPVNTCLKGVKYLRLQSGETVLVMGQGPIGIMLGSLCQREGARVVCSDLYAQRLDAAQKFGISETINAASEDVIAKIRAMTNGRGADAVLVAVGGNALIRPAMDAVRPGGRVMLFAQTQHSEVAIDPAAVCMDEKTLMGSYSASVDIQTENVDLVFSGTIPFEKLITHRFGLKQAKEAIHLAANPKPESMKIVFQPSLDLDGRL
jgi:L-iditol 2-dehydrogenase